MFSIFATMLVMAVGGLSTLAYFGKINIYKDFAVFGFNIEVQFSEEAPFGIWVSREE